MKSQHRPLSLVGFFISAQLTGVLFDLFWLYLPPYFSCVFLILTLLLVEVVSGGISECFVVWVRVCLCLFLL